MNCHLAITRVKFVYLIDACVLPRKLNRRFHNKRRRREGRLFQLWQCVRDQTEQIEKIPPTHFIFIFVFLIFFFLFFYYFLPSFVLTWAIF